MSFSLQPLLLDDTLEASHVGHRLAIGVQWIDALTQLPATGPLATELERIGKRTLKQLFDLHPQSRHALRWTGHLSSILKIAAKEKLITPPPSFEDDQTNFTIHCFAQHNLQAGIYIVINDPRHYVSRRLVLTPVQNDGIPTGTSGNIRTAYLWPGAAYPLAGNSTVIRGHIRRGATLSAAKDIPWARVIVTRPASLSETPNFAIEPQIGWGHGDDRGEFLVILGSQAVPGGAALPSSILLRVWVFLPPASNFDPDDPLANLPLEQAGSDLNNDILRGIEPPPEYVLQTNIDVTLGPGEIYVMKDATLLFP